MTARVSGCVKSASPKGGLIGGRQKGHPNQGPLMLMSFKCCCGMEIHLIPERHRHGGNCLRNFFRAFQAIFCYKTPP